MVTQKKNTLDSKYDSVTIGGKSYSREYVNDPKNQEALRQAVVNGNNDVNVTDNYGNTYENTTNKLKSSNFSNSRVASGINDNYKDLQATMLSAQQQARRSAINQYNLGKDTVKQQSVGMRNQASSQAALQAQQLKNMMAAQGLFKSGGMVTANNQVNNTRQSAMNGINQNEMNTVNGINQKIADLQSTGGAQDVQLLSQLEMQRQQALQNAEQRNMDNTYRQQAFDATQYQQGLDNQYRQDAFNYQKQAQEAQMKFQQDQQNIDNAYREGLFTYQQAQDALQQAWEESQFKQSQSNWEKQFNTSNQQWNKQFNADTSYRNSQLGLQREQFNADQAYRTAQQQAQQQKQNSPKETTGYTPEQTTLIKNTAYSQFETARRQGIGRQWLEQRQSDIITTLGPSVYYDMLKILDN